jgi:hypothetical protein
MSSSTPATPTYEWSFVNTLMELLPTDSSVNEEAKALNNSLRVLLVTRMTKLAQKTCSSCDGWGHTDDACPTAKLVTRMVTKEGFPEIKDVLVAANAAQKGKQFRDFVSHRQDHDIIAA